jgi:small-conductance mechanosensitive channel
MIMNFTKKVGLFVLMGVLFSSVAVAQGVNSDTSAVNQQTVAADTILVGTGGLGLRDTLVVRIDTTGSAEAKKDTISSALRDFTDDVSSRSGVPPVGDIISFSKIFSSILVLLLSWFITRFITIVLSNLSERFAGYRLVIKRLVPITKVFLWSIALYFIIAGILQPPLETVITVSASIGIAVGFASQDILRNIFGGIMIILDRPFQVGDKIEVDKQYGEVLEIGLRSVRIVTEDDSVVTVPNGEIMNKSVSNANSSALDCQVVAELFLPRNVNINRVSEICRKAAETSRYVYLNKPVYVHTTHVTLGPREVLKVRLKAYVLDIRFEQELRSDMTSRALTELNALGLFQD